MNLFELDRAFMQALETCMEVDEETGEVFVSEAQLESLQVEYSAKIDNIVSYIKHLEMMNDGIAKEQKRFAKRKKVNENTIERLKRYVGISLMARGYGKFETSRNKLSFKRSTSVDVYDLDDLADDYIKPKVELVPDKDKIKKDIQNGIEVKGARLVEKDNLQIK